MREHVMSGLADAAALSIQGPTPAAALERYVGIESISDDWEALADRVGASPFQRAGWMHIWQKHFSDAPVRVLSMRREGRVVALLPFIRAWGTLRSPTNFHTPEFGALAEDPPAMRELYRHLFAEAHHRIALGLLQQDGGDALECLAAAAGHGQRTLVRLQQQSPYIDLGATTWRAYEARMPAKLRSDLRRRARKLDETGQVTFEIADGRERLDQLLREGFAVEPSGWKAHRGTAIASRRDTQLFYSEVAAWAARRGSLRLAFLRLDGRPLAFQFGIEERGAYYFLKGGYDVRFRQFAPGKLLVRHMLARAFDLGLRHFEFLGAVESWKAEWTTTCRPRVVVSAFAPGALGRAAWLAERYGRPMVKGPLARVRRWRGRERAQTAGPESSDGVGGNQLAQGSRST